MQRMAGALLLATVVLLSGPAADAAAPTESCCACVPADAGTTAGRMPTPTTQALFCGEFSGGNLPSARCDALGGELLCLLMARGAEALSCREALTGEGIRCPAAAGAPAAGTGPLMALVLALAAAGIAVLRRRARS